MDQKDNTYSRTTRQPGLRSALASIWHIAIREVDMMCKNPIYGFCTVVFPIVVVLFFTTLMGSGVPTDLPVGVVDQDNTATSRAMTRKLDAFQTTRVVGNYPNMNAAREAIQRNEIYGFLLIPKETTSGLMNGSQPRISFYYSNVTIAAGSMVFRDLKTIASLGSAQVGAAKLAAIGKTNDEIHTFLQPITIDLHMINNPWTDYNVYLSGVMVPTVLILFMFLLTPYSIGTELKFHRSRQWIKMAGGNIHIALIGKLLPMTLISLIVIYSYEFYVYYCLEFPHPGGVVPMLVLGFLTVAACQGFGVFAYGLMPSLRMSMSVCSLWSVLGFSLAGATYPLFAMDGMLQAIAQLIPARHYYMIYQICIFNGYPLSYAWFNILAMVIFATLPIWVTKNIKRAMLLYTYIP